MDYTAILSFFGAHLSFTSALGAILALVLVGIRRAKLPSDHAVKRYGSPALSVALFPIGLLQVLTAIAYAVDLAQGERLVSNILASDAFVVLCAVSGFNNFSQVGRRVPWAVLLGAGTAALAGVSIYHVATGASTATLPALLGSGFIAAVCYVGMFFMVQPWSEAIQKLGGVTAYSPIMIALQVPTAILAALAAMGLVVL